MYLNKWKIYYSFHCLIIVPIPTSCLIIPFNFILFMKFYASTIQSPRQTSSFCRPHSLGLGSISLEANKNTKAFCLETALLVANLGTWICSYTKIEAFYWLPKLAARGRQISLQNSPKITHFTAFFYIPPPLTTTTPTHLANQRKRRRSLED